MLEIIVETVEDALAAEAGGATRLDLKADFFEKGLTPSAGMVEQICSRVNIEVMVMVRPHTRSWVLSPEDVAVMCSDIRIGCELGAEGFLLAALTDDHELDFPAIEAFRNAAGDLPLHFHMGWELTRDTHETLKQLISLGVKSVRTSGGIGPGGQAVENIPQIRVLQELAAGNIDLMLAGGVIAENIGHLVAETGVMQAHSGTGVRTPPTVRGVVDQVKVRELREALDQAVALYTA